MLQYFGNLLACRRQGEDRGVSAVEYGLLAAGIAVLLIAATIALARW